MTLSLVPHAPSPFDPRTLQLWVGVTDVASIPALTWQLNGAAVTPTQLRPLAPVLTGAYAGLSQPVWTGLYELSGLTPNTPYTIGVQAGPEAVSRMIRTLPESLPFGPQERFNILLLSCFDRLQDKTGLAGQILSQLPVCPHLTLFMGDQVYLDVPTLRNFPDEAAWLGNKFQTDYRENWFGSPGFHQVLALAPNAFLPDDHEYWNNYPCASPIIQNSWTSAGRQRWAAGADYAYNGFQQPARVAMGDARTFLIPPLSLLLLDTRSRRHATSRAQPGDLLGQKGRPALTDWADDLVRSAGTAAPRYGMLVTGQSLFRSAAGGLKGRIADFELPNYDSDYRFMVEEVRRVTRAGLPVLCATGDVHWGRIVKSTPKAGQDAPIFEVIASPMALVSSVFVDQAKDVWGRIRGLFGSAPAWPRHADPKAPPPRFGKAQEYASDILPRTDGKPAGMRGNHGIMLRVARAGSGLHVEATCYPLHPDAAVNAAEQWSATFDLRPTQ